MTRTSKWEVKLTNHIYIDNRYKKVEKQGYCCICGSKTNMMVSNTDYVCNGFGNGGLNPGSDAFCHLLYLKRRRRRNA